MLVASVRETALPEAVQYAVGLVGAEAALRDVWTLGFLVVPCAVVYVAFKVLHEMQDGTRQLLENMADAVDLRDPYTGGHSRRVTEYSAAILRELGLHGPEVDLIVTAARVHDIGKIGIPDAILNKPGKLDPAERAIMEQHPVHGAELLHRYRDFARGVALVRHHHESWDGTRLSRRPEGGGDPLRGARDRGGRQLRRHDQRPALPRGDAGGQGGGHSARRGGTSNGTPRSSMPSCARSRRRAAAQPGRPRRMRRGRTRPPDPVLARTA